MVPMSRWENGDDGDAKSRDWQKDVGGERQFCTQNDDEDPELC